MSRLEDEISGLHAQLADAEEDARVAYDRWMESEGLKHDDDTDDA